MFGVITMKYLNISIKLAKKTVNFFDNKCNSIHVQSLAMLRFLTYSVAPKIKYFKIYLQARFYRRDFSLFFLSWNS